MEENQQLQEEAPAADAAVVVNDSDTSYSWPVMSFDVPPCKTYNFHRQFRDSSNPNNFLKGVKWSPSGSCFLTSSEDNTLRLFPLSNIDSSEQTGSSANGQDSYPSSLVITEGESVYDYCWYPFMNASDVTSCVFATTTRDHPIHIWDATTVALYIPSL